MNDSITPLRRVAALATAAAMALGLTACAAASADPGADDVALVVAAATGNPVVQASEVDAALAALDAEGDRLVVVVADGEPFVALDLTLPALPGNGDERRDWLGRFREQTRTAILGVAAKSAEVDLGEAMALAEESFRSDTRRALWVLASGLQTAGLLSMLDGRLYAEPADLVSAAEQRGGVTDLSGVAVRMPRLGVVTEPQPALDEGARAALTAIWAEYFARAQAADVQLAPTSLVAGAPASDPLPPVTPVPIDRPTIPPVRGCSQSIGASSIGFAAGSAELSNEGSVRGLLAAVHDALAGCAGRYTVEGSASSEGSSAANLALSAERAAAVARLLAEVAVTSLDDIEVVGWGTQWPCRVPDLDAEGALLVDAAQANRVVVISKGEPQC